MERKTLYAEEGMILTNGKDFGKIVYLAEGANESEYYPITEAEYHDIMNGEQAEEADYMAALERFGVE